MTRKGTGPDGRWNVLYCPRSWRTCRPCRQRRAKVVHLRKTGRYADGRDRARKWFQCPECARITSAPSFLPRWWR
jgi:hypothetical protein